MPISVAMWVSLQPGGPTKKVFFPQSKTKQNKIILCHLERQLKNPEANR